MKFITRNSSHSTLHIGHKEKYVEEMVNTKFLGLEIDNHLNWVNHLDQVIPKFLFIYLFIFIHVCLIYNRHRRGP